jgi:DinB superfamily
VAGSGDHTIDFAWPQPEPPPVTTIAWRLGHIIVGVFGMRAASHFGGPPVDYQDFPYSGTAGGALAQLDEAYTAWLNGVRGLGADGLLRPCGPAEGPFSEYPMAALVLHINREAIHHAAEIALLRDLYLRRSPAGPQKPAP